MNSSSLSRVRCETHDLEKFQHVVAGLLKPFRLRRSTCEARTAFLNYQPSRAISAALIAWNNAVCVEADAIGDFYLVQLPLSGAFEDPCSRQVYSPVNAQLLRCGDSPRLRIAEDCKLLLVKVERSFMASVFESLTDSPAGASLPLARTINLDSPLGSRFARALNFTLEELTQSSEGSALPRWTEALFVSALLESTIDNRQQPPDPRPAGPRPYHVKRAEAYMEAHCCEDFTVGDVALDAGVSVRALQNAFRSRGTTLLGFRDAVRLDKAYQSLQRAEPRSVTVSEVALDCGFRELGRFSRAFRQRFGHLPKDVLKR